jgi:uncharacterized membrane protein YkoI
MGTLGRLIPGALGLCLTLSLHAEALDRVRSLRTSGDILALDVILQGLPRVADSRILEVELEQEDGLLIYQIERLETAGRVREYRFNARSGELIDIGDE